MQLRRVLFGSPIFQGRMQIVSFAARHLTTESSFGAYETSRLLDACSITRKKTVFSRKAPLEGAASWRLEIILLAKPLSLAVDYLL